jgi:hypothetical protein
VGFGQDGLINSSGRRIAMAVAVAVLAALFLYAPSGAKAAGHRLVPRVQHAAQHAVSVRRVAVPSGPVLPRPVRRAVAIVDRHESRLRGEVQKVTSSVTRKLPSPVRPVVVGVVKKLRSGLSQVPLVRRLSGSHTRGLPSSVRPSDPTREVPASRSVHRTPPTAVRLSAVATTFAVAAQLPLERSVATAGVGVLAAAIGGTSGFGSAAPPHGGGSAPIAFLLLIATLIPVSWRRVWLRPAPSRPVIFASPLERPG